MKKIYKSSKVSQIFEIVEILKGPIGIYPKFPQKVVAMAEIIKKGGRYGWNSLKRWSSHGQVRLVYAERDRTLGVAARLENHLQQNERRD